METYRENLRLELDHVNEQLESHKPRRRSRSKRREKISDEKVALEEYRDIIQTELLTKEIVDESSAVLNENALEEVMGGVKRKRPRDNADEEAGVLKGPRRSKRTRVRPNYYDGRETSSTSLIPDKLVLRRSTRTRVPPGWFGRSKYSVTVPRPKREDQYKAVTKSSTAPQKESIEPVRPKIHEAKNPRKIRTKAQNGVQKTTTSLLSLADSKPLNNEKPKSMRTITPETWHRAECIACFDTSLCLTLECNDNYCRTCLTTLLTNAINDEALYPPRCCQEVPMDIIRKTLLLTSNTLHEFLAKKLEYTTQNRIYCFDGTCSAFIGKPGIKGDGAHCGVCKKVTCVHCKKAKHNGDCEEDEALRLTLETAAAENWVRCKPCGRLIEKMDGCNAIRCLCGTYMCYGCGERACRCNFRVFALTNKKRTVAGLMILGNTGGTLATSKSRQ